MNFSNPNNPIFHSDLRLTLIIFGKPVNFVKNENLVNCDPKVHQLELNCPPGRRVSRKIVTNPENNQVIQTVSHVPSLYGGKAELQ